MNIDQLREQADVLEAASENSPIVTFRSSLRIRAKELRLVVKAWSEANGDGIDDSELEIVTVATLELGSRVYWPGVGAGTVLRFAQNRTGVQLEVDGLPEPEWVNVSSATVPVLACP